MSDKAIVAVTGATGFTGGALALWLAEEGHVVHAFAREAKRVPRHSGIRPVEGTLDETTKLAELVRDADTVFHIAAMYRSEGSYDEFLAVNFEATKALLTEAQKAGVRRFIYCSTIGVHGSVDATPSDENAPFSPRDPYQQTKLLAERYCLEQHGKTATEIVVIRPCGIYGPGDTRMLKIFRMVQKGLFFFVGSGSPNFHPVYIDDLVQGFLLAMRTPAAAGQVYIIGGRYMPLRDYVGTAAKVLNVRKPWIRLPYKPLNLLAHAVEVVCAPFGIQPPLHRRRLTFYKHNRAFSTAKARTELGYEPAVDLEEGFRRTVSWYREQGMLA